MNGLVVVHELARTLTRRTDWTSTFSLFLALLTFVN